MHQILREQFLPIPIFEAWNFFSSPRNLPIMTPPHMDLKILDRSPAHEIYEGMKISYSLKPLMGIPIRWETEISQVKKGTFFTDVQTKGPYRLWEHTHYFSEMNGGVLMVDEVIYQLPLGSIGNLVHRLIIKKKLDSIFEFRRRKLTKLFNHDSH